MYKKLISSIALSIVFSAGADQLLANVNATDNRGYVSKEDTTKNNKWKLIWSDEFNYSGLPDSTKWGYEVGLVRNNEEQFYTKKRKENLVVKDGFLVFTGIKEDYPNPRFSKGSDHWQRKDSIAKYTSASINTKGKASWRYGKIEVRAKLPAGKGVWPAIWMLGINEPTVGWPACGEIDIMEHVGFEPNRVHATMHFTDPETKKHIGIGKHTDLDSLSTAFHIYTLIWDEKMINVYVDNQLYHAFDIDIAGKGGENGYRKEQYLLLNLALGGEWGGKIDEGIFPQQFLIDYVRVYK